MPHALMDDLAKRLAVLRAQGLYKDERVLASPQGAEVKLASGAAVLNLCANNYLGFGGHPALAASARDALDRWGYGLASVRFICGTQEIHRTLEKRLAAFLGAEDAILLSSCFDANGGVFEALLGEEDAVISDELNHASIIDGIRLCKAKRLRYRNNDMTDLEARLREAEGSRYKLVVSDGVFSMDGIIADLKSIRALADKYGALVMVDDSHAVGLLGAKGGGTPEHCGIPGRIDILTGTLGKALGGASGGYVAARREVVDWLRQRARPYLFSNTLAPALAAASLTALDMAEAGTDLRARLTANSARFRAGLSAAGFDLVPGEHPIIPVLIGDAAKAKRMAEHLLA